MVAQSQAESDKQAALKDTVGSYYKTSMEAAMDASAKQPIVVDQREQTQFIIDRGDSMKELGYIQKLPDARRIRLEPAQPGDRRERHPLQLAPPEVGCLKFLSKREYNDNDHEDRDRDRG